VSELLSEIVAEGNYLRSLEALRDRLALELDASSKLSAAARDVAAVSNQLKDVLERISMIKPSEKSRVDELAEKRANRQRDVRRSNAQDTGQSAQPQ
jgi:hypothetical protein